MSDLIKKPRVIVLAIVGLCGTAVAAHASVTGWTVAEPVKKPQSIREGSARGPIGSGHHRTRYFIGGGLHRGK